MSNNNFGYGDNYPPVGNRPQASQSSHQSFPTSNAPSAPYYGLQASEAPGKTYSNSDYQYGQYSQTGASSANSMYDWGNYRTPSGTGAEGASGLDSIEQRLVNATRAPAQSTFDNHNLANLGYGSNLSYGTAAEAARPASDYSAPTSYNGAAPNLTTPRSAQYGQTQTQSRPAATTTSGSQAPVSQIQRQPPETTSRTNTASYNLPTPSPTYPQGLINSYPGNAGAASLSRSTTSSNARGSETTVAQPATQQASYTPTPSFGYGQQSRTSRVSPEQMRKTQTPTPPVPPIRKPTPEVSNGSYRNQGSYQSPQNTQAHNPLRETRGRTQATHAPAAKQAPVNVIRPTVGQPYTSPKKTSHGQRDMYQPTQATASIMQSRTPESYVAEPRRTPAMFQQQQAESRSQPPQEQPTSVDPSLVYNRYHEYQQQIKEAEAAEAEATRLAKIEEERKQAEAAENRRTEAIRLQKEAEAARLEKERVKKAQEAAKAAKAAHAAEQRKKKRDEAAAAVEAARTLAQTMSGQVTWRTDALQGRQTGEGAEFEDGNVGNVQAGTQQLGNSANHIRQSNLTPVSVQGTPVHKPILPPQYQQTPQPQATQNAATPATNDDLTAMMEEEMRKTVERLRDFQAKDPKLFLKVWSSVRKSTGGPGQSPQPSGEGSQAQGSPALGSSGIPAQPHLSYAAGPSSAHQSGSEQRDVTAPVELLPVPPPVPKKPRIRRTKKVLQALAEATQNQESELSGGGELMMQTDNASAPPLKRKPGRPSNAERELRAMNPPQESPPKRKPGRPKGSKTKAQKAMEDAASEGQMNFAVENHPPQQHAEGNVNPGGVNPPEASRAVVAATTLRSDQQSQFTSTRIIPPLQNTPLHTNTQTPQSKPSVTSATMTMSAGSQPNPLNGTTPDVSQPRASVPQSTGNQAAQWPDEHIDLIAETGSNLLNSLPQNAGKKMLPATIRNMLRTSPSYVQVCQMIEKEGFYMDRSKFARTLLNVIQPNAAATSKPQPQPQKTPSGTPVTSIQAQQQSTQEISVMTGQSPMHGASQPSQQQAAPSSNIRPYSVYQPPKYGGIDSGTRPLEPGSFVPQPTSQAQSSSAQFQAQASQAQSMADKGKYTSHYEAPRPTNTDDFNPPPMEDDDRDMHQLSLLKAYVGNKPSTQQKNYAAPHPQQQNQTPSSALRPSDAPNQTQAPYTGIGGWSANMHVGLGSQSTLQQRPSPYESQHSTQTGTPSAMQPRPNHELLSSQGARTPSGFNMATGSWNSSTKRPHSEAFAHSEAFKLRNPLLGVGNVVGGSSRPRPWGDRINGAAESGARASPSSASPFRVSATTPQPQMHNPRSQDTYQPIYEQPYLQVNIQQQSGQHSEIGDALLNFADIAQPLDTSYARRRKRYDPKTIARDILVATGRHTTERPLNGHLDGLKRTFRGVNNQSDLSTFRWDLVDPGGDEVGSANKELREKMAARRMGPVPSRGNASGMSSKVRTPSGLRNETIELDDDEDAMDIDVEDTQAAPQSQARSARTSATPGGSKPSRQGRNPAPNYKPMAAADLKGLRIKAGRRDREDSVMAQSDSGKSPGVHYVPFVCLWQHCNRQLLNLETLRRHMFQIHGQADDVVSPGKTCMWWGCGNDDYTTESDEYPGTHFANVKEFKQHMENDHLKTVAQLYGDGPKSDVHDGNESEATTSYLFDDSGRQVTPSVASLPIERGNATTINSERLKKLQREQTRKDRILDYWNIDNFEHYPLKLNAKESTGGLSKECMARYLRTKERMDEEYGAEFARAVKESEGLGERGRKAVYAHDMPKSLKRKLGVD